jgi:hypothetical protein
MTADGAGDGERPDEPTEGTPPVEHSALPLHLWTTLDWRFLVPVLQPKRVGHGEGVEGLLLEAVRLLDPGSVAVSEVGRLASGEGCDLVILVSPTRGELRAAVDALMPGGWLCVQAVSRPGLGPEHRTMMGWRRALVAAGLEDVAVHWHPPAVERSTRMVPVAARTAVRNTLLRHQAVRFGRAKSLVGRAALALGVFALAIREGTVVGRAPERTQAER